MKKLIDFSPVILLIWSIIFLIIQVPNIIIFEIWYGTLLAAIVLLTMIIAFLGLPITWLILKKKKKLDSKKYKIMFLWLIIDMILLNILWQITYFSGVNFIDYLFTSQILTFVCYGIGLIELLLRTIAFVSSLIAIFKIHNKNTKEIWLLTGISLFVTYLPVYAYSIISIKAFDILWDNLLIIIIQVLLVVTMFVLAVLCYKLNNTVIAAITGVLSTLNCAVLIYYKISSMIAFIESIYLIMGSSRYIIGDIIDSIFTIDLLYIVILAFISIGAMLQIRNDRQIKNSPTT